MIRKHRALSIYKRKKATIDKQSALVIPNSEFRIPNSLARRVLSIVLLLLPVLLLSGCFLFEPPVAPPPETDEAPPVETSIPDIPEIDPSNPGQFTIRYIPDSPTNPITSLTRDNIILSSLLYESLFAVDGNLNVYPVLCEDWSSDESTTYTFAIKEDVAMSDGTTLTADDVVYSLRQAMQRGRFVNRLRIINRVDTYEDLTVTVVLSSANNSLIQLLDIPIIKSGSIDSPIPPGTGPYNFAATGAMRLERFSRYRDFAKLPLETIYLLECEDNEMAELFDTGVLSLLWDDPSDTLDIILNRHNEARLYDTTTLQFIGYNTRSIALKDPDMRRAIGCSINRQLIIDTIIPGQPLLASLALSPSYRLYSTDWEQTVVDPLQEMSALFRRARLEDFDNDSFLEYPDGYGGYIKFALEFIVNSENPYKVRAAHRIADTLKLYGIEIIVLELPWDSFLAALNKGEFDIYYGEIVLGADFDLSSLLLPNSIHNYGQTGSDEYRPFITDFLSAQTEPEKQEAAAALCDIVYKQAPFVPILYKRYVVYTPVAAITGASPSQSGVFSDFANWTVDLAMIP